jgi:hypothetical protein
VFFLPVEASSLIASVGGIAELAKDAMQQQVAAKAAPAIRAGDPR